jgi:hypothetical protein
MASGSWQVIRQAVSSDIPTLVKLGRNFHAASKYAELGLHYDPMATHEFLDGLLERQDAAVLLAEDAGGAQGIAAAIESRAYFSRTPIAIEIFWWVEPGERRGVTGLALKRLLTEWAEGRGCELITMVSLAQIEGSPAEEIYKRQGHIPVETTWMKRIK